jgi:hypothetical protein
MVEISASIHAHLLNLVGWKEGSTADLERLESVSR